MKKLLLVSGLAAVSGLVSGVVAAAEVGKVLASTPVMKTVSEPKTTCANDADGKQQCRTQMTTETRTVGYKVIYEYAGKQHTVQMATQPGATVELQITPVAARAPAKEAAPKVKAPAQKPLPQAQPIYSTEVEPTYSPPPERVYSSAPERVYTSSSPVVVERYVSEPVYVDPVYYPRPYYYPGYYFDPLYPIVGLAVGYSVGRYGFGWRGGYRHSGHGRR